MKLVLISADSDVGSGPHNRKTPCFWYLVAVSAIVATVIAIFWLRIPHPPSHPPPVSSHLTATSEQTPDGSFPTCESYCNC